jgi:hypothetical protein
MGTTPGDSLEAVGIIATIVSWNASAWVYFKVPPVLVPNV